MKRSFLKQLMRVGNIIPGIAVLTISIPGFFIASTLVAHAAGPWFVSLTGSDSNDCLSAVTACLTIQGAVNKASTGDTINVAAGTYTETVTVGTGVMITGSSGADLTGEFDIDAANTTISGFSITNSGGDFGVLINGVGNVNVSGNTINGVGTSISGANAYGVWFQSSGSTAISDIQIENNIISSIGNSSNPKTSGGIGIGDSTSNESITGGLVITGNTISSILTSTKGAYGIIINLGANGGASVAGATISSNDISGLASTSGWEHAIGLETNTPGAVLANNTVHGLVAGPADIEAVHFEMNPGASGITLTSDTFNGAPLSNSNAIVTVNPAVPTIAEANTYPEALNGSVYNYIGLNLFPTVQAGVTGVATSGTVNVAAGTYTGQVAIAKSLSLVGAGSGSSFITSPTSTLAADPDGTFSLVAISGPATVDVSGFTIEGPGPSGCDSINFGIYVRGGAMANINNNAITSIRDNPFSGCQDGIGIQVGRQAVSTVGTATITNNVITDYQKAGIEVDNTGSSATITGNTVTGDGATATIAQNGIEINRGATASVVGNTVSGNEYAGTGPGAGQTGGPDPINDVQSFGILLYQAGDGVQIATNTISGSDGGIYNLLLGSGTTTISSNQITGNRYAGIEFDQGNASIIGNTITGSGTGIAGLSFGGDGGDTANSNAVITGNTITGATDTGIKILNDGVSAFIPNAIVHGNNLSGDAQGVQNLLTTNVSLATNATGNWWGAGTGPSDSVSSDGSTPDTNPSGTGSPAIGAVNYGSWCISTNCAPAFTVTIDKFIDGQMATALSAGSAAFPMVSSWNATNLGAPGSGSYSLSTVGFNSPNAYEAVTSPMVSGSSYTTNEDTSGAVVGPDCTGNDPFALTGYSTGATLALAASSTISTTIPNFTNLTSDEYVIVWNHYCLAAPTLVSPTNGTVTTTAGLTSTDWNSVTDPVGGITYVYQASNSSTTNPDGSFTAPVYTSGPLTATMIPTPGTPAGVYFWHVMAMDADGNVSPWSTAWTFTVDNTGTLVVEKDTLGGNGTFTFTGTNGLGAFSITTTNGSGIQTFNNLTPGTYTVTETNTPKGWTQTDSSCSSVVVTAGGIDTCTITDTSNKLLGEISGTKYVDVDGDGTLKDGDHHRLAGVTIYLDTNNNGVLDSGEQSTVTDKFGDYHFSNLPAGTYHVREVEQAGWMETVPASGSYTIVLAAGKISKNDNFGDFQFGTISGMKFNDLNGNGRKDKNEPGIAGWTITLTKLHSTFTETAVTDANGNYSFTNLGPGTYQVREVPKTGWYETTQNPPNITIDSGTVSKNDNFGNHLGKVISYPWFHWFNGYSF